LANLNPQAWRSIGGCTGKASTLASPILARVLRKPAGVIGASLSDWNTWRPSGCSRVSAAAPAPPHRPADAPPHPILQPRDVQQPLPKIDLIQGERAQLPDAQPGAIGDRDHDRLAMAIATALPRRGDQHLDLGRRQIFA